MTSIFRASIAASALSLFAFSAFSQGGTETVAQTTPASPPVEVTALSGPPKSVVVVRGSETLTVTSNFQFVEGDVIMTRATGAIAINAYGCSKRIDGLQSMTISPGFCERAIVSVEETRGIAQAGQVVAPGVTVGAAGPFILLAALGGGTAALVGGDDAPSSP